MPAITLIEIIKALKFTEIKERQLKIKGKSTDDGTCENYGKMPKDLKFRE